MRENSREWSDEWTPETKRVEIDRGLLREIVTLDAGEPGLFRTLVDMFRHDTESHLPILRAAAREGDTATLSNLCHSLAGEAAQIGAWSVSVHCRAMETAALDGDFALTERFIDALVEHLEHFVDAVERELWGGESLRDGEGKTKPGD